MSAKRKHEVRPAVLVRESIAQLVTVMYLLDTCIRYSTYYFINFQVSEGCMEALNQEFSGNNLIDYIIITS